MKFSYNWLKKHIGNDAPSARDIESMLTMKAFEVEEVSAQGQDFMLDIKVLPDRSHDALSHIGMAREIVNLYNTAGGVSMCEQEIYKPIKLEQSLPAPSIVVKDHQACPRFMAVKITNIKISESTPEIKALLETIGQKSINNVVDATNYVLYDLGKPMHVFDADKVNGTITVRFACDGEELTTLDGKNIKLDESILVIADESGVLSVAGVKGGTRAEVDGNTTNIIIESANFSSTLLRKTSNKVGIKTDAVKRFENGISSELCGPGLKATANLILKFASTDQTQISAGTDIYQKPERQYKVGVSATEINKVLGTSLTNERVQNLLGQRALVFVEKNVLAEVMTLANESVGKAYKRGASVLFDAPEAFDCSSLTAYLYKEAGLAIPRIAVDQYVFSIERTGEVQVGDLLFINTGIQKTNDGSHYSQVLGKEVKESAIRYESVEWMPGTKVEAGVDHVGIYIGDGYVVHATSSEGWVVSEKIIESSLFKNGFNARYIIENNEDRFVVTVPFERLDMRIKEDLIDEVGKLVGTVDSAPTTKYEQASLGKLDNSVYAASLVRSMLLSRGFSEVMTSSFSENGDIKILNSVDPKKHQLRNDISTFGMVSTLEKGLYYMPALGKDELIKTFEIGSVFSDGVEKVHLSIGLASKNKKIKKNLKENLAEMSKEIYDLLLMENVSEKTTSSIDGNYEIVEFAINSVDALQAANQNSFARKVLTNGLKYQTLSNFPFITRDVAFFVQGQIDIDELERDMQEKAGKLCQKIYQFDRFQKDGEEKISYAYRLVFQAFDRTLTDGEVEPATQEVYKMLVQRGFEVR